MQSPINTRDLRLQATSPRLLLVGSNYISLSTTSSQFKYGSDNVAQPSQSVIKATLIGALSGQTVTFSYNGLSPAPTAVGNTVTVLPDSITGDFATITATLTFLGITYTSSISVSKVYNQLVSRIQRPIDLITSANDGTGYTLPSASNYLELYNGITKITSGITYGPATTTKNGLTVSVNTTTGQITVTQASAGAWTTDSENFTLSAVKDTVSYNSIYTITKAKTGATGSTGAAGAAGATVEISGLTTFYRNAAGTISPANAGLSAITQNITSPTYSWTITGATPTTSTSSTVTITPGSGSTISVSVTVNGSNLANPITTTRTMAIVDQGVQGQAGQRGIMSAYPSMFQWLPTGTSPSRPNNDSTYTWSDGSYQGAINSSTGYWWSEAPSNTTPGYTLWQITIPLTVEGTTTTSPLPWTSSSYAMRAISVTGTNGGQGPTGPTGANGSATYLIDRGGSGTDTQPTNYEVNIATGSVGRPPAPGDIANILYSSGTLSKAYVCTSYSSITTVATWSLQTSYITGSLIVEGTITGSKIAAGTITANKITSGTFSTTTSYFTNILGDSTYIDGLGGNWTIGMLHRRAAAAPTTAGPDFVSEDLSDTPGTYAAYFYSKYGGAAKFQAQASAYGNNTVYISGTRADAIYINAGNGTHTNAAISISGLTSYYGIIIDGNHTNQGIRVNNTNTGASTGITSVSNGTGAAIQCENKNTSYAALSAIGTIIATGNVIAYYSDDRLKTKLGTIPNALEKLNTLSGFYYEPNEVAQQLGYKKRREIGVSAQDVQKILPEIIHKAPVDDKYLTVDYERLIPLIIEAIKELDRRTK